MMNQVQELISPDDANGFMDPSTEQGDGQLPQFVYVRTTFRYMKKFYSRVFKPVLE